MKSLLGRLLCLLGLRDFRLIDVTFGFGPGGSVAEVQCQHCGLVKKRRN